jgi:hypothetical protein
VNRSHKSYLPAFYDLAVGPVVGEIRPIRAYYMEKNQNEKGKRW